jgi:hypothetical protein
MKNDTPPDMQKTFLSFWYVILCALVLNACTPSAKTESTTMASHIPTLEKISGDWVAADTVAMEPSLRNFRGQALVNRDMTSISWFVSAPFSGGYHSGVMKVNGDVPVVQAYRWQPFQALRKTSFKGYDILSSTRMLPDEDAFTWQIDISNATDKDQQTTIDLDLIGFISKYGGDWQWWYPFPTLRGKQTVRDDEIDLVRKSITTPERSGAVEIEELINGQPTGKKKKTLLPTDQDILNSPRYKTETDGEWILVTDNETGAVTGFGFATPPLAVKTFNSGGSAQWKLTLKAGEKKTIQYFMAYGDNVTSLKNHLKEIRGNFNQKFEDVQRFWENRWAKIFTPGNDFISGCFPILETSDTLAKRVYYTGPLTALYMTNTNLPQYKRVILTGGPKWGASISFFWDNTEWAFIQAISDPQRLKDNILLWMKVDPGKNYGFDNFGGKGVGNAYSANYYALFQLVRAYTVMTKDYNFLDENVNGRTILETLEQYATNWEKISSYGKPGSTDEVYKLADFGDDEWNLLECVPTYKHIVPSFNATYIWMMRETAKLHRLRNNHAKADTLDKKADELIPLLMKLYAGNGVWNCLYPGNKTVEVRHVMDFIYTGRFIPQDIPASMRKEMTDFLYRELMTNHWMRAQSLQDVAAKNSDRPDHGPLGAFDGWPAATMDALVQFDESQKALDFYRAMEPLTHEGSWAQAHELWGDNKENKNARVRIAERGWHARDAIAGIGMSQVMVKCFFGLNPEVNGEALKQPGNINLDGKLYHVLYGGEYYTMERQGDKVTMSKEMNAK